MHFVTVARFPAYRYHEDEAVRAKAQGVKKHFEELAVDEGLIPESNVILSEGDTEVHVAISEPFDSFLREAPGSWRYY